MKRFAAILITARFWYFPSPPAAATGKHLRGSEAASTAGMKLASARTGQVRG